MKQKQFTLANCITMCRIVGACGLLFTEEFSKSFYILYTLCGFSDVLDGTIARMTKTTTKLGSKLDSIADLLFYSIMFIKVLPEMIVALPLWNWCVGISTIVMRIVTYAMVALRYKRFSSLHTYMNKVTGFAAFCMPYSLRTVLAVPYCSVGCIIAALSTLEEFLIHITSREYPEGKQTIFHKAIS